MVGVLALVAGIAVSRFVISPAELAASAEPPTAGPVTAAVEQRVIENAVTARADVTYADPVDVKVDATGLAGPAVVTGHVPEIGSTLVAGSVALEVAGRPLIVLPGELPVYRSLHIGVSGPDVTQLKAALASLGIDAGDAASALYDAATAAGVESLFRAAGYPPPSPPDGARQRLEGARSAARSASAAVDRARAALEAARAGASEADRLELDNAVRQAQRELDVATASGEPAAELERLRDALHLAEVRRTALDAPPGSAAEQSDLDGALSSLTDAQEELGRAEAEAATPLPAGEVVFLTALPRRVDRVGAERGSVLQGAAMSVSGAEVVLSGTVSEADAALVPLGGAAKFTAADGTSFGATVRSVTKRAAGSSPDRAGTGSGSGAGGGSGGRNDTGTDGAGGSGSGGASARWDVVLVPASVSPADLERLKGGNVRVSIPVESTGTDVIAVPVAAVTAGPGGESRVELVGPGTGSGSTSVLIEVVTGLSAGGFVELRTPDARLLAGARVVVGR
ncbi:hypothetical protein [Herbiconiux solani]|uniref:hypothetical protein n=1 Tax=Herbiconiux solani TaxID=661329 RepID=UPI000824E30F|nr:hypothetical protein [Herbiconiux solani]